MTRYENLMEQARLHREQGATAYRMSELHFQKANILEEIAKELSVELAEEEVG